MKLNPDQLNLFPPGSYIVFSNTPCIICGSNFHVINVLVILLNDDYSRFCYLCEYCRSKPWFLKESFMICSSCNKPYCLVDNCFYCNKCPDCCFCDECNDCTEYCYGHTCTIDVNISIESECPYPILY